MYHEIISDCHGGDFRTIMEMGYEQLDFWNKVDSFFKDMPLRKAIEYYNDTAYCMKYYSFLKILGQNDSIAFKMLRQYIADSTQILHEASDLSNFVSFNQILSSTYESFIDSKYYWCDPKTDIKRYFRRKKFMFTKYNYAKWPAVLSDFIKLIEPFNIRHYHKLEDLKYYRGVEYFHGR